MRIKQKIIWIISNIRVKDYIVVQKADRFINEDRKNEWYK